MTSPSSGTVKQIEAGVINVGYVETGPPKGPPVLLLHGWPYDVHSYAEVAPRLGSAGYRVIVPYLRGFGPTLFRSIDTIRNGQQSALGLDAIALMDALDVRHAIMGGFDWGARAANVMAALWPDRCKAMVSVSGYLIGNRAAAGIPLVPEAEYQWWYQYYFATERGRAGYDKYRREFARIIWRLASPRWHFDDATFEVSAAAFDNPDHVAIVILSFAKIVLSRRMLPSRALSSDPSRTRRCPAPGRRTPSPLLPPRSVVAGDELSIRRRGDQSTRRSRDGLLPAVRFDMRSSSSRWHAPPAGRTSIAAMIGAADRGAFPSFNSRDRVLANDSFDRRAAREH